MCNPAITAFYLHAVVSGLLLKNVVGFFLDERLKFAQRKVEPKNKCCADNNVVADQL